jgi:hypothetical protein
MFKLKRPFQEIHLHCVGRLLGQLATGFNFYSAIVLIAISPWLCEAIHSLNALQPRALKSFFEIVCD